MTTLRKIQWFWAWDDEKEEAWLREMAQAGWHLTAVVPIGIYSFEKGVPRDDVYRLDFFTKTQGEKGDYLQLFQDAGWDYVGEYGSWQYFRTTTVNGETPEIFTDNESKSRKYQRLMFLLIIFLPIYSTAINSLSKAEGTFYKIFSVIMAMFMLLYAYAMIRLLHRVTQLKKKI